MKRKSGLVFGFIGVLAISIGFTDVSAKGQVDSDGDKIKILTVEEQESRESKVVEDKDVKTVITAEEQDRVEGSSVLSGFVPQENGQGFYFIKEK
ncbi:hypothetical protein [Oceanobacillus sp. J11TS1]|uniref:hypothetical protein n=1 Tax=Oceanobacillus sp. J11TS1 TaxID=2807191 RepID=UPI001B1B5D8C|nr:hypothetical protein [Oceanobacillus sp. J11TS1]GIO24304.1 hypothetical protein J11TS1_28850 [Oceanobacillus sp. J11TS1]